MAVELLTVKGTNVSIYPSIQSRKAPGVYIGPGFGKLADSPLYQRLGNILFDRGYSVLTLEPTGYRSATSYDGTVSVDSHTAEVAAGRNLLASQCKGVHFVGHSYHTTLAALARGFNSYSFLAPVFKLSHKSMHLNHMSQISRSDGLVTVHTDTSLFRINYTDLRNAFTADNTIQADKMDGPVLFVEAGNEVMQTCEEINAFENRLPEDCIRKRLVLSGADHNFTGYEERAATEVLNWLDELADSSA